MAGEMDLMARLLAYRRGRALLRASHRLVSIQPKALVITPLAMAVVFAMLASYLLSRTLIPTMVHYLLRPELKMYVQGEGGEAAGGSGLIWRVHHSFNHRFERMRTSNSAGNG